MAGSQKRLKTIERKRKRSAGTDEHQKKEKEGVQKTPSAKTL